MWNDPECWERRECVGEEFLKVVLAPELLSCSGVVFVVTMVEREALA